MIPTEDIYVGMAHVFNEKSGKIANVNRLNCWNKFISIRFLRPRNGALAYKHTFSSTSFPSMCILCTYIFRKRTSEERRRGGEMKRESQVKFIASITFLTAYKTYMLQRMCIYIYIYVYIIYIYCLHFGCHVALRWMESLLLPLLLLLLVFFVVRRSQSSWILSENGAISY